VNTTISTCGDADEVLVDEKRDRAYVTCGEGFIDVFQLGGISRVNHIPTAVGARTALYDPDIDWFFLAVRATQGIPAAIWMYKPVA
jgi:hypothetical protein